LPYWLEQMEDRFDRHRFWANVELPRRPLQYFRDHFTFSFQEDHAGVALRHSIGIDNICWANDFPHSVGDWPWSNEVRARQFNGLPIDEVRKIQGLNIAAQLGVITPAEKAELAAGRSRTLSTRRLHPWRPTDPGGCLTGRRSATEVVVDSLESSCRERG